MDARDERIKELEALLDHYRVKCDACGSTELCFPEHEGEYDDTYISWYCLDAEACKVRCEQIKAERKRIREERQAAKKAKV